MSTHVIHPEVSRPAPVGFEDMLVRTGERSGATIAIAVHSTALGPALGGARLWHYDPTRTVSRTPGAWRGR